MSNVIQKFGIVFDEATGLPEVYVDADGKETLRQVTLYFPTITNTKGLTIEEVAISTGAEYPTQSGIASSASTAAEIATFNTAGKLELQAELSVTVEAITGLEIWGRINSGQAYKQLYATAADFTGAVGRILLSAKHTTATMVLAADADITTLTLLQTGTLVFNCSTFESIQLKATSFGSAAVVATEGFAV